MTFETELRDRLDSAAWYGAVPGDDRAAADAVIERRRSERRNRAVLGTAATCGLLLLAMPVLTGRWLSNSGNAPHPATPPLTGTAADAWPDPPRGSLAKDAAFLEAVRTRAWQDRPALRSPVRTRRVAFAGDVSGIRWVLVTGRVGDRLGGQWFTGPAGTAAADLVAEGVLLPIYPELSVADVRADATGATLLVVARPGDDVQVSPAVTVDATGKVRRAYTSVETRDGVAVIREAGAYAGVSLRYRVLRNDLLAGAWPSSISMISPEKLAASATGQTARRRQVGTPSATAFSLAVEHVLAATGFGPGDVAPVLLWSGPVPAPGGAIVQGSVVAMTMPSGAVVVGTGVAGATTADEATTVMCGAAVAPAGTALDDVVAVAGCEVSTVSGTERSIVATAPTGYDTLSLRTADGRLLSTQPLVAGSAAVPDPGTVKTAVLSGPGRAPIEVSPADPRHDVLDVG